VDIDGDIPQPTSPYMLMAMAQRGESMNHLIVDRLERLVADSGDVAALMDLALMLQFHGERDQAMAYQRRALESCRLFIDPAAKDGVLKSGALRVLCLMAPGDLAVNQPVELLIHGRDIALIKLYLAAGEAMPAHVPDHDVVLVAISEYDETRQILDDLCPVLDAWPRPVVNHPRAILNLGRDTAARLLEDAPGLAVPGTVRWSAGELGRVVAESLLGDDAFPLIVRPVGTHGGKGLARVDDPAALAAYVDRAPAPSYHVAPFVDYRSADGHYRKYRVALIAGRPYLCHLAISEDWMVHYAAAGMEECGWKRDEEALGMQLFDLEFMPRHQAAFQALADRLGLDFAVLDCAETQDGQLLYFEADNAGAVHDLDPPNLFPYKLLQMRRIFDAFEGILRKAVGNGLNPS
jgi:hypothetical protein